MPDWIGYRWLIERFGLTVTQALRTETVIGSTRATVSDGTTGRRTVLEQLRPEPTLAGHLSFALKHEGVHLEALSRLFAVAPAAEVEDWIRREPTGRYARRTGFLYECLTRQPCNAKFSDRMPCTTASVARRCSLERRLASARSACTTSGRIGTMCPPSWRDCVNS